MQHYAWRLHHEHSKKKNVGSIDFVDASRPASFVCGRLRGYRAMVVS